MHYIRPDDPGFQLCHLTRPTGILNIREKVNLTKIKILNLQKERLISAFECRYCWYLNFNTVPQEFEYLLRCLTCGSIQQKPNALLN